MSALNLFVGIDVAKSKLDVCFLDATEATVHPNAVYDNRPHGWTELLDTIESLCSSKGLQARCAMESTGFYHEALCRHLCTQKRIPLTVSVLNPRGVKNLGKAMLKDTKTDKVDSRLIAQYEIRMKPTPLPELTDEQRALKEITRSRRRLMEDRNKEVNRLHTLLHRHYPGYQEVLGKELTASLVAVLSVMQSPRTILDHAIEELVDIRLDARHRVRRSIAVRLQELASEAPVQELGKATKLLIGLRARRIRELDTQLRDIDSCISELVKDNPQGRLLMSIPGVGPVTTAIILSEVGDIRLFNSKEEFVGYCGLYPIVWESGQAKRRYRMTRKGNRWLKTALLVVTGPARLHNPTLAAYSERLKSRGKSTKAIGGALARKLAHMIWAIMTSARPWSDKQAQRGQAKAEAMLEQSN